MPSKTLRATPVADPPEQVNPAGKGKSPLSARIAR